jgi:hypothetical protein
VIEENGGKKHAAPTPCELGKGQEEEEESFSQHSENMHPLSGDLVGGAEACICFLN